jgi:hypothetical protein
MDLEQKDNNIDLHKSIHIQTERHDPHHYFLRTQCVWFVMQSNILHYKQFHPESQSGRGLER